MLLRKPLLGTLALQPHVSSLTAFFRHRGNLLLSLAGDLEDMKKERNEILLALYHPLSLNAGEGNAFHVV